MRRRLPRHTFTSSGISASEGPRLVGSAFGVMLVFGVVIALRLGTCGDGCDGCSACGCGAVVGPRYRVVDRTEIRRGRNSRHGLQSGRGDRRRGDCGPGSLERRCQRGLEWMACVTYLADEVTVWVMVAVTVHGVYDVLVDVGTP